MLTEDGAGVPAWAAGIPRPQPADGLLEHPGFGEPMTGVGHPADGTESPEVSNGEPEQKAAPK